MSLPVRTFVLIALAGLTVACGDSTRPLPTGDGVQMLPLPPIPPFPAVTRAATIYLGPDSLYSANRAAGFELHSRYVLYDDDTFALQTIGIQGFGEFTGRYARADSIVTFDWDGWSTAGPWGATGTFRGDSLVVKYNPVMQMTDFIDGTYVRPPGTQ